MEITREFVEKIPKTDLHVHLDGSLRISTLIDLAKEAGVDLPSWTEDGLKSLVFKEQYENLGEYLRGFAYTTAVLQTKEALQRASYELAIDNINEGVRYIEVRFAPQLHQNNDLGAIDVLKAVNEGLTQAKKEINSRASIESGEEPPFNYGIITCAMRMFDYNYSDYFDTLLDVHQYSERNWIFSIASQELVKSAVDARDNYDIPIVGFDLAGMEKGYPAVYFKPSYSLAQKNFIMKTVHAGEDYGPESIFQAIAELNADRIGHGVYLFNTKMINDQEIEDRKIYVRNLVQYIADRRITIEVCLTSNMQTNPNLHDLTQHSFSKMREAKLSVTFCTDNRTVSSTTVTDEILKACKAFNLTEVELKNYVIYGFKRSFYPDLYKEKRKYVRQAIDYYDSILAKFSQP